MREHGSRFITEFTTGDGHTCREHEDSAREVLLRTQTARIRFTSPQTRRILPSQQGETLAHYEFKQDPYIWEI